MYQYCVFSSSYMPYSHVFRLLWGGDHRHPRFPRRSLIYIFSPVGAGASPLSSLMCPDLLHWPQLPMTHPAACWLHMSVCVLAVFIGVCRLPGSLQVSVSIIQRAEQREPAELWMFSLCTDFVSVWMLCHRVWQSGLSSPSFIWRRVLISYSNTNKKESNNKYLTNNAFFYLTLLSVCLLPRCLPTTLMTPQPRRIFNIWHM